MNSDLNVSTPSALMSREIRPPDILSGLGLADRPLLAACIALFEDSTLSRRVSQLYDQLASDAVSMHAVQGLARINRVSATFTLPKLLRPGDRGDRGDPGDSGDSVRCGRHRFGGLTEQANARSMATLGVVPAAIFPGAVPKAFAAEKVIRLRKAGRLAIMALLNNVPRHSCQIQTRSPWHRGGRNL